MPALARLPAPLRVAAGGFAALVLGFVLLAQANLWAHVGEGGPPGPRAVLLRFHGDPDTTILEEVLDPALPYENPRNMSQFLGGYREDEITRERRALILDWIAAGAPESGWETVAPIFTDPAACASCHVPGGQRKDLPFQTYEQVLKVVRRGDPPPLAPLLLTSHNHLFAFAVLALLLAVGTAMSSAGPRVRLLLVTGAFGGAALDVGSWFLTRAFGSPFHWLVMAGGALFGACATLMALWILVDVVLGRRGAAGTPGDATD